MWIMPKWEATTLGIVGGDEGLKLVGVEQALITLYYIVLYDDMNVGRGGRHVCYTCVMLNKALND